MWYVYVLKSLKDGKFYIGSTSNLENRITQHNSGRNVSTRNRRPFELVYSKQYNSKQGAWIVEHKIKSYKGGEAFKNLISGI